MIGQPHFATRMARPFGPQWVSGSVFAGTGERLWCSDAGMNRVLLFRPFPTSNDPVGAMALGRDNFTDYLVGPVTAASFSSNHGVFDTGQALLVADAANNRILIWTTIPTSARQPANLVLGQTSFETNIAGAGADQLRGPSAVWSDGDRVAVADTANQRVLIWRTFPTRSGQPADVVLGQSGFGQGAAPPSPTARNLFSPQGIASDGRTLAVADTGHLRILVWNAFPDVNVAPADVAIGQRDLTTVASSQPGDPHWLGEPRDVALVDGAVFVADGPNQRVLVFDPIPTSSLADVARAQQALGQANPSVVNLQQEPTERSMLSPYSVSVVNGSLFVGDGDNNRALRYRLDLP